jgi:hypothetical protein
VTKMRNNRTYILTEIGPVAASSFLILLSYEPDASSLPSGEKEL